MDIDLEMHKHLMRIANQDNAHLETMHSRSIDQKDTGKVFISAFSLTAIDIISPALANR